MEATLPQVATPTAIQEVPTAHPPHSVTRKRSKLSSPKSLSQNLFTWKNRIYVNSSRFIKLMRTLRRSNTPSLAKLLTMWCYLISEKSIETGGIKQQKNNYSYLESWVQSRTRLRLALCQTLKQSKVPVGKMQWMKRSLNASLQFQCIQFRAQHHSSQEHLRVRKLYWKRRINKIQLLLPSSLKTLK